MGRGRGKMSDLEKILTEIRDELKGTAAGKEAKAAGRSMASQEKRVEAANRAVKLKERDLELLGQEEKRLKKIGNLISGNVAAFESQKEAQERLNEQKKAALELEKAIAEEELAGMNRGDAGYKEKADAITDLDGKIVQHNKTSVRMTEVLAQNAAGYKDAIQYIQQSALIYGKHDFANVQMLTSFRNLAKAMISPTALFEVMRATVGSLINTMFAFTLQINVQEHAIMRATGASKANAKAMMANAQQLAAYGVEAKDVTEAVTSLRSGFQDFTFYTTEVQAEIKDTSVLLNQLGVSFNDTTKAMQIMAVTMGMTGTSTAAAARDLSDFAHTIQVIPSELISNYAAAGDSLAKFGDRSISAFQDLAIRSKVTTLEIEKMLRMVEKFDTFEGAAEQAGKLNAALGGNFVNAMDLMMTTDPAERFDMIREAILNTGLTFDDMSYYQRKFFTEAAGLESVADLAKVMRGDIDSLADGTMQSSDAFEKLAERTKAVQDIQQRFKTALMTLIPVFEPLIENLEILLKDMDSQEFKDMAADIMESVQGIAKVLIMIIPHIDTIFYTMAAVGAGRGALGMLGTLNKLKGLIGGTMGGAGSMATMFGNLKTAIANYGTAASSVASAGPAIAGSIGTVSDTVGNVADAAGPASQGMNSLTGSMNQAGPSAAASGKSLIQLGVAALLMGAGIGLAAYGVSFLVESFSGLGDAAWPAVAGILAFGVALALFAFGMSYLMPVLAAGSAGIGLFAMVVGALALSFGIIAAAIGYMSSSLGDMFKQLSTEKLSNFKEVMGYFATGTGGVSTGIKTVTENIDLLVTSLNAITTDNITALGDAMLSISSAAGAETTGLKNDMTAIMNMIDNVSLPKINATTALIGAIKDDATTSGPGGNSLFPGTSSSASEKVDVKVFIGNAELKSYIRTEVNERLAELGPTN